MSGLDDTAGEASPIPQNMAMEQALLGAALFDNEVVLNCAFLDPTAFFEPFHERVWAFMKARVARGVMVDPVTVGEAFKADPAFQTLGGIKYLADLFTRTPRADRATHYAKVLSDLALRRHLIKIAGQIADSAMGLGEDDLDAEALAAEAERLVIETSVTMGGNDDGFVDFGEMMRRAMERSNAAMNEKVPPGISTGISDLDAVRFRFRPGTVTLIGGRPGMGKSVVGTVLATNIAKGRGAPGSENYEPARAVALYSLEMPEEQTSVRFASFLAYDRGGVVYGDQAGNPTYEDFEFGKLSEEQMRRVYMAIDDARDLPIFTDFRPNLRVSQIVSSLRRWKRKCEKDGIEPGPVIIDHFLHLGSEPGFKGDTVERHTRNADDLLHAAKKLNLAFVVLCQLGRGVDSREDKRPSNSDLKWTGSLEENAFATVFLYRPEYYNRPPEDDDDEKGWEKFRANKVKFDKKLFWLIEKNRGGRGGQQITTFCDIGHNVVLAHESQGRLM